MPIEQTGVYATLLEPYSFPEGKFTSIDTDDFAVLTPWFEKWSHMNQVVDREYRSEVIQKFIDFHNLDNPVNESPKIDGAKETHHSFTDYMYSDHVLPSLVMLHEYATIAHDEEALKKSSAALVFLNDAIDLLNNYAETQDPEVDIHSGQRVQLSRSGALARLMSETIDAKPKTNQFLTLMKIARLEARQCLWEYQNAPVDHFVNPLIEGLSFADQSRLAINEFIEAKNGIDIPDSFVEQLIDPKTKALVLSIDINSTFNTHESFTNVELLKKVNDLLRKLTKSFKLTFSDTKRMFIVLNTGRPAGYFWGAVELGLNPIPEVRMIGVAENGGAEVQSGMQQGIATANVENPKQWEFELEEIEKHISSLVTPPARFEKKLSMVAMEVKARNGHGDELMWKHTAPDGEIVTDEWIRKDLAKYFTETLLSVETDFNKLRDESKDFPEIETLLSGLSPAGNDAKLGTLDDVSNETINTLREMVEEHSREILERINILKQRQNTLRFMQENIVVKFNPTAGFVDIMMKNQNKYSGLMHALRKYGYMPNDVATVHIGDAAVDIMPSEVDEFGNPIPVNEGADDVLVIGVHNSSQELRNHIAKRGNRGYLTARDAASGVVDILEGFIVAVSKARTKILSEHTR